jgi:hypothetical protein
LDVKSTKKSMMDNLFSAFPILMDQIEHLHHRTATSCIILSVWILMATVLTNSYKSLVIMKLNTPTPLSYPDFFKVFNFKPFLKLWVKNCFF